MKRLLVTGVSGFLGWNICQIAPSKWEIFGTCFSNSIKIPNVISIKIDLTNYEKLKQLIKDINPSAIIHTAAAADPIFCQKNPYVSNKINVETSVNIAGLCSDLQIPYIFTSTDLVFDGLNPPYYEDDSVCPVNIYGEQKVLAETGILKIYPKTAICRMPLMFGLCGPHGKSFIQPMIESMKKGKKLNLFTDEIRNPISGKTAATGLFLALDRVCGILHLGGNESISRYDFGKLMAKVFKFNNAKLIPCLQKDLNLSTKRPPDVSLDNTKAICLGFRPLSLVDELSIIYNTDS